jgi:Probable cobalt transporter subunit (CbtA)
VIWPLLRRGLLVGVCAGLLAGCFAFVFGEPLVQDAIDIEQAGAHASVTPVLAHVSDWAVSRPEQRGGLFLATALYGACVGTLFAVAFAVVRGRGAARDDWQLSIRLAAGLFAALVLVPFLKYPANPPAVGDPETIGERTWLYLAMLAGGLVSLVAAARVMWSVDEGAPSWRRPVLGAGTFVALTGFLALILPGVDEVPSDFPASLLWEFRLSALGSQAVLWTALGVGYGIASLRAARASAESRAMVAGPRA